MKKKIFILIICFIFLNSAAFSAQVRKKLGYTQDANGKLTYVNVYYLVNSNGAKISTQEYDYLSEVNPNLFIAKDGDKYGLINAYGKSLVSFEYQDIIALKYNVLRFKIDNKFGLMNFSGAIVLPAKYSYLEKIDDRILKYSETSTVSSASGDDSANASIAQSSIGLMDYKGNIITEQKYSYIDKIDNYLLRVIISGGEQGGDSAPQTSISGKYGLIDYAGKVVLNPQFDYLAKVNNTILKVKKGQSWGRVEFYHGNILNVMMDYQSYW